ncbi:MAG: DsrE family protein [Proteobacteria bacterium]|jgi:intracellular sulfur oxidation DsrE/DsrF family protein|nr:DsrE family protein [Pseudomonadota bacterium]MCG6936102.1 DsrE family protein [Pseudomonadota bacterium]
MSRNTRSDLAIPLLVIVLVFGLLTPLHADSDKTIKQILSTNSAPEGVVFEIATGDSNGLSWAIPKVQTYIKQLREKFPELSIAVVTHGREMFAMQETATKQNQAVHQTVRSLTRDQDVPVYVCGTYAGWRGLAEEDFPDYVDVAAAGPAQINDFVALGYTRIIISNKNRNQNEKTPVSQSD